MKHWADDYVGVPWEKMDCWALAKAVLKKHFQIELEEFEYSVVDPAHVHWALIDRYKVQWSKVQYPKAGDVVLFNFLMSRPHVGVCLDGAQFLHSTRYAGVCVERFSSLRWKRRIEGVYRHLSRIRA